MATTTSNVNAAHAINRYLWSKIEDAQLLSKASYNGLVPIVPIEEAPDLMTVIDSQAGIGSLPYVVYTWNKVNQNSDAWYLKTNQIAYAVRSADDDKMRRLVNLFEQEFQDYDQAAHRVNTYLAGLVAEHPLKAFSFKHINVVTLGGGMPTESENGVNEALITISATFVGPDFYYGQ